jgi:hypothetical protein
MSTAARPNSRLPLTGGQLFPVPFNACLRLFYLANSQFFELPNSTITFYR